ncbi:unnamed protein product [Sympodiomycopsis kandeliae]
MLRSLRRKNVLSWQSYSSLPAARQDGILSYAEDDCFPHAETSAAGAARYRRLQAQSHSTSSQTSRPHPEERPQTSNSTGAATPRAATQTDLRDLFSRDSIQSPKRSSHSRESFNHRFMTDLDSLERRYQKWNSRDQPEIQHAISQLSDIGWETPAEMMYSLKMHQSDDPTSVPHPTDRDAELVNRSIWRGALLSVFSLLEPIVNSQSATKAQIDDKEDRAAHLRAIEGARDAIVSSLQSSWKGQVLLPADTTAFHIVATMLVQAQIICDVPKEIIKETLDKFKKVLKPAPLPLFHRIMATAGKAERFDVAQDVFTHAFEAWDKTTDEWMLYARARAFAGLPGSTLKKLSGYWKEYASRKVAPPRAYGPAIDSQSQAARPLIPPKYLFAFILKEQMKHQSSFSNPRLGHAGQTLRAMIAQGYQIDGSIWLLLLRTSPNLRLQIPELVLSATGDSAHQKGQTADGVLLQLLRRRAQVLDVRNVFRISHFMHLDITKRKSNTQTLPESAIGVKGKGAEYLEALSIVSQMLGRLGYPLRAYDIFLQCAAHPEIDQKQEYMGRAAGGVMSGFDAIGQPQRALEFGHRLLKGELLHDQSVTLRATSNILATMLRSAACMEDKEAAIKEALLIKDYMVKNQIPFDSQICSGLTAFPYILSRQEIPDWQGLRLVIRYLLRTLQVHQQYTQGGVSPWKAKTLLRGNLVLTSEGSRRTKQFIRELQKRGLDERVRLRQTKHARSKRKSGSVYANPPAESAQSSQERAEWIREMDFLVQQDLEKDQGDSTPRRGPQELQAAEDNLEETDDSKDDYEFELTDPRARKLKMSLHSSAHAMRLRVLAVIERDHIAAAQHYRHMIKHGKRPSMYHIAPIVEGLCLDGRAEDALRIAQAARRRTGQLTTARIQTALLKGLLMLGKKAEAEQQFREWRKAGGQADHYMFAIFRDSAQPILATKEGLDQALQDARARDEPLRISQVDESFRWLMAAHSPRSAHQLILEALDTGTRIDYPLREAVRNAGNWIRKLRLQPEVSGRSTEKGIVDDNTADDDGSSQSTYSSFGLRSIYYRFPHLHPEESNEALAEALELQQQIIERTNFRKMEARDTFIARRDKFRSSMIDMFTEFIRAGDVEDPAVRKDLRVRH